MVASIRSGGFFDYDAKRERLEEVERELENPDVWNDSARAQALGRERSLLDKTVNGIRELTDGLTGGDELLELAEMEDDEDPLEIAGIERNHYLTHAMQLKHDFDLLIENIGVGIAKNVNFKWVYNVSEVKELIKGKYYLTPSDTYKNVEYLSPGKSTSIILPSEYLS